MVEQVWVMEVSGQTPDASTTTQRALGTLYAVSWFVVPAAVVGFSAGALGAPIWLAVLLGLASAVAVVGLIVELRLRALGATRA